MTGEESLPPPQPTNHSVAPPQPINQPTTVDVGDIEETSENRGASSVHLQSSGPQPPDSSQTDDSLMPASEPPQIMTSFQSMLKSNLQDRFMYAPDIDPSELDDGGDTDSNTQEEVRVNKMTSRLLADPEDTEASRLCADTDEKKPLDDDLGDNMDINGEPEVSEMETASTKPEEVKPVDDISTDRLTNKDDLDVNGQQEGSAGVTASEPLPPRPPISRGIWKPKPIFGEKSIKPCDIFTPHGKYRPIRLLLTHGIAGIGKTFLVNKFILDWTEGRSNQDVHLTFPFNFRQLNTMKGKKLRFAEFVHKCIKETKGIDEDALNVIFAKLQTPGQTYDQSAFKVLFVLDGWDECSLEIDLTADEECSDLSETISIEIWLANLISGRLLPAARLWITSRPLAAGLIPRQFIDMITEVRGFTDLQKEAYFRKKFIDEEQASRIINHIKSAQSIYTMCHIPVFCWIYATIVEDLMETTQKTDVDLPTTLTQVYTTFLNFQIKITKEKSCTETRLEYLQTLTCAVKALDESAAEPDREVSVVIKNLPRKDNEVTSNVVNRLIKEGLKIDHVECVTAERKASHISGPEDIVAKFSCLDDKNTVMEKKATLLKNKMYRKVYINHDKPYEGRFLAIVREKGKVYVGGGRIVANSRPTCK